MNCTFESIKPLQDTQQLRVRGDAAAATPWLQLHETALQLRWADGPLHFAAEPGSAEVLGATLGWNRIAWTAADPGRALLAGRGAVALALVDPAAPPPGAARLPAAALRISYEWVLMRSARRPAAAEARLRHLPLVSPPGERAFTLGGWPAAGPARLAAWWARIRPALSVSPA